MRVAVVDYGVGNIFSVISALNHLKIDFEVDLDGTKINKSDVVLVPGVAAFGLGMQNISELGQRNSIQKHFESGNPLIGLCLGAQMFLESSEESEGVEGLSFVPGLVKKLDRNKCTVPHQGWAKVKFNERTKKSLSLEDSYFYFSHGYRMEVEKADSHLAESAHGLERILAVYKVDNVLGVQFHPERSGETGLKFLSEILSTDIV